MRVFAFILIVSLFCTPALAQNKLKNKKAELKKAVETRKERSSFLSTNIRNPRNSLSLAGQLNTNGYGAGIEYEQIKKHRSSTFTILLSETKADKEEKFRPTNLEVKPFGKPKPYVFGKENSLYNLNFLYGQRRTLVKGLLSPSIDISVHYFGGISMAVLKPYSLKLKYGSLLNTADIREETYSNSNELVFLNQNTIYSRGEFKSTISDILVTPGLVIGTALEAEIGQNKAFVKRIKAGGQLSAYSKSINILVKDKAQAFYYCAFIGLSIGKRW